MPRLVVKVKFANPNMPPRWYHFFTTVGDLHPLDLVVVDTVNGYQVAIVKNYVHQVSELTGNNRPTKWVVQKVDIEEHSKRLENIKRSIELKKKLEAKRKKAEEVEIYSMLAKVDPEAAQLLEEYKQLQEVL